MTAPLSPHWFDSLFRGPNPFQSPLWHRYVLPCVNVFLPPQQTSDVTDIQPVPDAFVPMIGIKVGVCYLPFVALVPARCKGDAYPLHVDLCIQLKCSLVFASCIMCHTLVPPRSLLTFTPLVHAFILCLSYSTDDETLLSMWHFIDDRTLQRIA